MNRLAKWLLALALTGPIILGPGALATADPGVLEAVEVRRIRYHWGLDALGGPGVARLAVDDCELLGARGVIVTDAVTVPAYVVDCCAQHHRPLADLGLVADVNWPELNHKQAIIALWTNRGTSRFTAW